jgi:hypothetical protein
MIPQTSYITITQLEATHTNFVKATVLGVNGNNRREACHLERHEWPSSVHKGAVTLT